MSAVDAIRIRPATLSPLSISVVPEYSMPIEFDPKKDALNLRDHGISLQAASDIDLDTALRRRDARHDYGEDRFQALGMIGGRLHMLVYTMRGRTVRAISLRKANDREVKLYGRTRQRP